MLTVTVNIKSVHKKDIGVDSLLALNGSRFFVDDKGDLEAIFKIQRIAVSPGQPHGLK